MSKDFELTRNEKLDNLLGMEISWNASGECEITQQKYISDMLTKFGLSHEGAKEIPMAPDFVCSGFDSPDTAEKKKAMLKNAERYQGLMGALLWISRVSHPEIIAAVTICAAILKTPL